MMKTNLVENVMPIVVELKNVLERQHSPLLRYVMLYIKSLMAQFREEVNGASPLLPSRGAHCAQIFWRRTRGWRRRSSTTCASSTKRSATRAWLPLRGRRTRPRRRVRSRRARPRRARWRWDAPRSGTRSAAHVRNDVAYLCCLLLEARRAAWRKGSSLCRACARLSRRPRVRNSIHPYPDNRSCHIHFRVTCLVETSF
jgi:hypothetical protein